MASQTLTEYERRRLENIKRNDEMVASLKLHSTSQELSSTIKRKRIKKKPKEESPIVIRRSLRGQEIPADRPKSSPRDLGPLSMRDAYSGTSSDRHLIDSIMSMSENGPLSCSVKKELCSITKEFGGDESSRGGILSENTPLSVSNNGESDRDEIALTCCSIEKEGYRVGSSFNLRSLALKTENIAWVVPGSIMNVQFFPTPGRSLVVAGNKFGDVGFWNVDCKEGEGDGVYLYRPHTGPISGISIQPFALSKVFTSCHDGFIRLLDVEKESFNLLYSSEDAIFSLSQRPHDAKSLYFGKGLKGLNVWDVRVGKFSSSWVLHDQRINTIDFHPENTYLMATSSSDGTACIWDLRSIDAERPKFLKRVDDHRRAVHSAYFSPSGSCLATTSTNDKVGVLSGVDFADVAVIRHKNSPGGAIPSFRAIWGWDDSYLFIGNMKKGVDVISPTHRTMMTLESPHISAIPCRFAAHPYEVGTLAVSTRGGQVCIWTSS